VAALPAAARWPTALLPALGGRRSWPAAVQWPVARRPAFGGRRSGGDAHGLWRAGQ